MSSSWTTTDEPCIKTDGDRFRVRVRVQDPTGERVETQRTLPPSKTLDDAIDVRERLKREIRTPDQPRSRRTGASGSIETFGDYVAERWWPRRKADLASSTIHEHERIITTRLLPKPEWRPLGGIALSELARWHIEDWIHWAETVERERGDGLYRPATLQTWWKRLSTICKDAVADRMLEFDPTARLSAPTTDRDPKREQRTLTLEQLYELCEAARRHFPQRWAEVSFFALTGCRAGEGYALRWDDVDLTEKVARIRRSAWRGEIRETTKTGSGRVVPLPDYLVGALQAHQSELMEEQGARLESGLVFPTVDGEVRIPQSAQNVWNALEDELETDIHLTHQVLRRSYNTVMRRSAVDPKLLQDLMGHSTQREQDRYTHFGTDDKRQAVEARFDAFESSHEGGH